MIKFYLSPTKVPVFPSVIRKILIFLHVQINFYSMFLRILFFPLLFGYVLIIAGCQKIIEPAQDCTAEYLARYTMVPYTGQTDYCHSLTMYLFENRPYYSLDCCVCDMLPNASDCENNNYFLTNGEFDEIKYNRFFEKSIKVGIVGVLK